MNSPIKLTKLEFNSSQLERGLSIFQAEVNKKLTLESKDVCEDVLKLAKLMCPTDTGFLRDSGYIEELGEGKFKVGFSAEYAAIVHEKPSGWQKSGETQFLTKAIKDICGEDFQKLKRRLV